MSANGSTLRASRAFWIILAHLVAVGILVRWPLLWETATVTPDGAEYLAIARSLRETGRYATDLKWQFYTSDPVRHAAWTDRPPLYPAFAALCALVLPGLDSTAAARVGNVLLTALAQILAAFYLRRLFGPLVGLAAAGYVFLLPHTVYWTSQPLTESLTLLLVLGALLLWTRIRSAPRGGAGFEGGLLPAPAMVAVGGLCGLAYLTRPTGALLLGVLLLDLLLWRERPAPEAAATREKPAKRAAAAVSLLAGYLLAVLPYHFVLWKTAGSPFASALGFTFTITTIHDVTVLGFERPSLSLLTFLREHGAELPVLLLRQAASHAQGILLPLLGLLPFALRLRPADLAGPRRAGCLLVVLLLLTHTLTWSAKGSSRYFLFCLLFLAALLIAKALEGYGSMGVWGYGGSDTPTHPHTHTPPHPHALTTVLLAASAVGLAVELGRFMNTQLRPDYGLPSLPAWKAAAARVGEAELVASDHPWILNLLTERPAVMLPRTTDPEKLGRFLARYRPDVLVLFPDEPTELRMRDAWRADMLPAGWRVVRAEAGYLEVRPTRDSE